MAQELSDADVFGTGAQAPAPAAMPVAPPDTDIPPAPQVSAADALPPGTAPVEVDIDKGVVPPAAAAAPTPQAAAPEMSDADVFGGDAASAAPAGKPNFGLGLEAGMAKPAMNLEMGINAAAHAVPFVGDALDKSLKFLTGTTIPEAVAQYQGGMADAAKQGMAPGAGGQMLGSYLGLLPTLALPGGPIVAGAAGGALTSNAQTPLGLARDATLGGVLGKVGDVALNGILNTVAPKITDAAQTLIDSGMRNYLSPGQLFGKHSAYGLAEAAGQAVPVVGEMIRKQGNDALIAANRAVASRVASGFGGQAAGDTAEDVVRSVGAAKNSAYDISTPAGTQLDPVYGNTVGAIRQQVHTIPASTGIPQRFDNLVRQEIASRADPATGVLSDDGITSAKNAISAEVSNWAGDSSGWAREYTTQLRGLRRALTDNLGRASPEAQAQLSGADANYPAYKIFQNAMKRGTQNSTNEPGWFTPQQLQSAITSGSPADRVASGTAPLQDLASAMKEALPRKFKDVASPWHAIPEALVASGVAGSDILGGHGGALTAGMLAGIPAYSKLGQHMAREALLRTAAARMAAESKIGPLQRLLSAPAGLAGGLASSAIGPSLLPQTQTTP